MISANSRAYREAYRGAMTQEWQDRIFSRDGSKCSICGTSENLKLAHVTSMLSFVIRMGLKEGPEASMREDNLITLCRECHKIQHGALKVIWGQQLSEKKTQLDSLKENGSAKDYLRCRDEFNALYVEGEKEAQDRLRRIERLLGEMKRTRGWGNPSELAIRMDLEHLGFKPIHDISGISISKFRESMSAKSCNWRAGSCQPPIEQCECGLFFCAYHRGIHLRPSGRTQRGSAPAESGVRNAGANE
jgi:hypothetical protein